MKKVLKKIFRFNVCRNYNWMTDKDYVSLELGVFWYALPLLIIIPILL